MIFYFVRRPFILCNDHIGWTINLDLHSWTTKNITLCYHYLSKQNLIGIGPYDAEDFGRTYWMINNKLIMEYLCQTPMFEYIQNIEKETSQ